MKGGIVLLLGIGGLLLYSLFRKGKAMGNLVFFPHSIKSITFQGISPVITLGLAVQNTSNQGFTLYSMAGSLYANNYLIGNVSNFEVQTLSPNSEIIIYIKCKLSPLAIVTDIINAIKNNTWKQNLQLQSIANIDNLQVPIDLSFKVG